MTTQSPKKGATGGGTAQARPGLLARSLDGIERVGNKIPDPFVLFLILFAIIAVLSTVMSLSGATVEVPGSEDGVQPVRSFFSAEGITWLTTSLVTNFVSFPPLGVVLTVLLGVGVAERTGLLTALVRRAFGGAPRWLLPYVASFVAVSGSIMSDAAMVVIPPLAAMVFKAAGRHPVAGLLGAYAAATAAFSCSPFVTSTDALLSGVTNAAAEPLGLGTYVSPISNYFITLAIALILSFAAGFMIDRVLEPSLVRRGIARDKVRAEAGTEESEAKVMDPNLTDTERRGLRRAGAALLLTAAAVLALCLPPGAPMRNEDGAFLPESPLLSSVVFIVFMVLLLPGVTYGVVTGSIRKGADLALVMGQTVKEMSPFIVLAFVMAQFLALFNWTNMSSWIAIQGAEGLEATGFTGFGAILCFILLAFMVNLFIISGSAMWALLASVFVPMFALLGYEPGFIQAAFRIGDSTSNVLSPLSPYLVIMLGFLRAYEPRAGIGTVIARCLPFTVVFTVLWIGVLAVFYFGGIPVGPGMNVRI
ncbi:AbgT family transporter [Nocardiopsis sp. NPDC006198]|uniref:AbgT family transporter n=1 Tax=Streptomonospora nanhaiensis TaxID=1323731 RepID=A0ABY6YJV2_9ACTN|nr:AbgT family transporter [Streptomonospora nanhaiensis]WAE72444.1 AbgT family transporter [Streptomonospora nanhaiensis]